MCLKYPALWTANEIKGHETTEIALFIYNVIGRQPAGANPAYEPRQRAYLSPTGAGCANFTARQ